MLQELDFNNSKNTMKGRFDIPNVCPICKTSIVPNELSKKCYSDNLILEHMFVAITFLCPKCNCPFISSYEITDMYKNAFYNSSLLYCEPNKFVEREFSEELNLLSPDFVKIYNEALAAETAGLASICGVGYRKAFEFLIKDFLISEMPEKTEDIKDKLLGNCIKEYINNDNIKAVATRSAWLGNDHSHYIQKFNEYDLNMLKKLMDATIFWINAELTTKEALKIEYRK